MTTDRTPDHAPDGMNGQPCALCGVRIGANAKHERTTPDPRPCRRCDGTGRAPMHPHVWCIRCDGTGYETRMPFAGDTVRSSSRLRERCALTTSPANDPLGALLEAARTVATITKGTAYPIPVRAALLDLDRALRAYE